jgi:DNA-binding MarR family transcriptional regulator
MKRIEQQKDAARLAAHFFVIGRLIKEGFQKRNHVKPACSLLHLQTLRYVKEERRPLMRDVAQFLSVTPPAATLLIDGLVKEGLLARSIDTRDRRTVRLRITAAGNALFARGSREAQAEIAKMFSVLDAKEQTTLVTLLEKVAKSK